MSKPGPAALEGGPRSVQRYASEIREREAIELGGTAPEVRSEQVYLFHRPAPVTTE